MTEISVNSLVEECKLQNTKAQMQLYEMHYALLYTIAYRILKDQMKAEDVMQEVFIKFFKESIYQLKKPSSYLSFLKRSVANKSIDEWKKFQKEILWDEHRELLLQEEMEMDFEVQWTQVLNALETLPEKYRVVIELYYIQEYSHEEISKMLNISNSNSRVTLKRGMDLLKKKCNEIKI